MNPSYRSSRVRGAPLLKRAPLNVKAIASPASAVNANERRYETKPSASSTPQSQLTYKPEFSTWPSKERMSDDFRRTASSNLRVSSSGTKKACVLFYTPETEELAKKVAAVENSNITLGKIRWRKFADSFPDLLVEDAESIRNKHVAFLGSFHNPSVIFEQVRCSEVLLAALLMLL
jgi:hypothetical protein